MKLAHMIKGVIAGAALAASAVAMAQPVAGGTVKVLVGFVAGGPVDAVARAFAEQLRDSTGATVLVENRPGASSKIAIDALLGGSTAGDTIAVIPSSLLVLAPQVLKSARYDAVRDFAALGVVAEYGFAVGTGPAANVRTLAEYATWAKANPKSSSFGTPGLGTPQHFLGAQLQKLLDIELTHVPYRGGAASVTDVIGGQIPMLIAADQLLVAHEGQGKVHTLIVTSRERNPKLPKVPTAREAGYPQLEAVDWFGVFAKAGTSPQMVAAWRTALGKAIAQPKYVAAVKDMGYALPARQPENFASLIDAERAAWTERVKLSGFNAAD